LNEGDHHTSRCRTGLRVLTFATLLVAAGCGESAGPGSTPGRKLVVTTTTMIADLARQIAGPDLEVVGIMKPGTDPHIYDPTPQDSIWVRKPDLVLVNGLHLEGRRLDMIAGAGQKAVELGRQPGIRTRASAAAAAPDPHVWWNPRYFMLFAEGVRDAFIRLDPARADAYRTRAADYLARLQAADRQAAAAIETIAVPRRYMITSHDAFYYYGEAYGLHVDAVLGISTDAQARADDPDRLARLAAERGIPAVFHETSVSAAQNHLVDLVQKLAREKYGHEIRTAGPLYSDSLGPPGSEADTYLGAFRANSRMIVQALGGQWPPPTATGTAPGAP